MVSIKSDRTRAILILHNKLEPLFKQLNESGSADEAIEFQSKIIETYHNFINILEILEKLPTGQGNKGDDKLLLVAKETFLHLEEILGRKPKSSEFKKSLNNSLKEIRMGFKEGDMDKNIEKIYKKLCNYDFWLMEELKSIYLPNKK